LTVFEKVPNAVGPPSTPRKLWIGAPHHLGGIVVNNAILLVTRPEGRSGRGWASRRSPDRSRPPRRRLRPILITTLTTILGLLPLALGIGEGSDAQAPLARAVVGGLTGSTLITLVLIPMVFASFHPDPSALQVVRLSPAASQTRGG